MKERCYRVGVVGSSFGGSVHVPAFAAQGRFEVVALASPRHAAEIAAKRNVAHAFASVDEMLDGVELDVVSVASPPFAHHAAVSAALKRGLHVLCEKPFTLDVAQAEELVAAAERAGTVCALAHEFRYTPPRQALHELARNGHLGTLRGIEITQNSTTLRADSERPNSWWFERRHGGGMTGAALSHVVDQANWFAGRAPVRVAGLERTANVARHNDGETFTSDVADGAFATLDYGDGLVASVAVDATRAVESVTVAVHGETRTAVASGPDALDLRTFVVDGDETSELELTPQPHANLAAAHPNLPPFVTLLDAFAANLDGNPASLPTFDDGLATQRVLAAIGYRV
ncbi:MAG: Gfo/Idh/MocA family oxidoreductase [Candidatus Eremiobacteraeota bacterium]|nr:Gfo/Idh/MocA family oxidoreductase [Candidatus Eremiobacteraeota bacterium]MBC5803837.1 Gfo/Idh/MocA family oxidoreductase [Candidatus Eremiobacteraeota bacterium]MBC5821773.1 Gfo/Idh/MocA family oxidoreductase [Candidatus Eremiobacteraeota bacterium]